MVQFNVGDRVRRVRNNRGFEDIPLGSEWTVIRVEGGVITIEGDPRGGEIRRSASYFELIVEDQREDLTFYTIVYNFNGDGPRVYSYSTQRQAEEGQRSMLANHRYEIIGLKKIKVKI